MKPTHDHIVLPISSKVVRSTKRIEIAAMPRKAQPGSLNNDPSSPLLSGEPRVPHYQLSNAEIQALYADDDSNGFVLNALASPVTAVFNLANAAIGAGVLAFPYAYSLMGR